jgi:alpha-1,6-mannosyltransferase
MANYPGGKVMHLVNAQLGNLTSGMSDLVVHDFVPTSSPVHIHLSNLAAQTGASLFTQEHAPPYLPFQAKVAPRAWVYNKTEGLTPRDLSHGSFTHLISEAPLDASLRGGWKEIRKVDGFAGWSLDQKWKRAVRRGDVSVALEGFKDGGPLWMKTEEKLVLVERY